MDEILIIEDEILIGMNIKQIAEDLGYDVCKVASNPQAARQVVEEESPEVILMDIKLAEDEEGFTLTSEFKSKYDPVIIAVTSYSDDETMEEVRTSKMDGYLLKPIDESNLSKLLEALSEAPPAEASLEMERGELF